MNPLHSDARSGTQDPELARAHARGRLIVALDVPSLSQAAGLVDALIPVVDWFKVGSELYTAAGPDAVSMVLNRGGRVFLDLKYHDIPNTVARAVTAAAALGVSMLNVHIAGGLEMLRAAGDAAKPLDSPRRGSLVVSDPNRESSALRPLIVGVTLLTSDADPLAGQTVIDRARTARDAGLDGVVASAREAAAIKAACGRGFLVVTPGIRPRSAAPHDQRRTMSPSEAAAAGSDYLVVGRPIIEATDPRAAAAAILHEIERFSGA